MLIDYEEPLEHWLDSVEGLAEQALAEYKTEFGTETVAPRALAKWLSKQLGGDIGPKLSAVIDMQNGGYIVPMRPSEAKPFLFTEAVPVFGEFCELVPNPVTAPLAARLVAARTGRKVKAAPKREIEKVEEGASGDESSNDFEEDVRGEDITQFTPLRDDDSEEQTSAGPTPDRLSELSVSTVADLDAILANVAGVTLTSLEPVSAPKKPILYRSLKALTTKSETSIGTNGPKVSNIIRQVVKMDPTTKHELDDRKAKRREEIVRKANELDKFYGMKRQTITPEIRQELQAINLRAYANPQAHYRSAKRGFDLAEAESGFFQMGHIIPGGLHDKPLKYDGSTLITQSGKRRKVRSLVKDLLLPN